MPDVSPSVPIPEQTVLANHIVVRSGLTFFDGNGENAQRDIQKRGREDSLRTCQTDSLSLEVEASLKVRARKQFLGRASCPSVKELERRESNPLVKVHSHDEMIPGQRSVGTRTTQMR